MGFGQTRDLEATARRLEGWLRGGTLYRKVEGLQEPLQELLLDEEFGRCISESMETSGDGG